MEATTGAMQLLNDDHLKEAVTQFAQGKSRTAIVSYLIDTDERLREIEPEEPNLRKKLSDLLRCADPTSTRFSKTKYGELYKTYQAAFKSVLANKYDLVVNQSIEFMSEEIAMLKKQREELDDMIDKATNTNPVGPSEFLAVVAARNNATKRIHELSEKLLERLERVALGKDPL